MADGQETPPARLRTCVVCGTSFDDHARSRGRHRRLCSEPCRKTRKASQAPAHHRNYYAKHGQSRLKRFDRICANCGKPFQTTNYVTRCCGISCGLALSAKIGSEGASKRRKFASRADRDRHYSFLRRAAVTGRQAEQFAAVEIFERDGWRCRICGEGVDRALSWPDPGSASLDHIVPIAKGGQHTRANVQCAHLGCNSAKGARTDHAKTRPTAIQADPEAATNRRGNAGLRRVSERHCPGDRLRP